MSQGRIQLEVLEGSRVIDTRAFAGTLIEIGKLSKSDLQLTDENVSRRHAKIEIDAEGHVKLIDLDSTNGTKLNGMRITTANVSDGDEIEIGLARLRVRFDAELKRANQKVAGAAAAKRGPGAAATDSFYRTQDDAKRGGRLALEGALLWDGGPVQAESFSRETVSPRLKAFVSLVFAVGPLLIAGLAYGMKALGAPTAAMLAGAVGAGLLVHFMMDVEAWKTLWREALTKLSHGESVYIGESANCRFFVPSESIGGSEFPLIVPHKNGWGLDLRRDQISGDLLVDGKVVSLDDPHAKSEVVKGGIFPITPGTKARLKFGKFSLLLGYVTVPARSKAAIGGGNSIQEFAYLALSLILHFSVLILFVYLQPEDDIQIRRPKNQLIARLITVESIKNTEKEKEEKRKKEEELPEKVDVKDEEKVVLEDATPTPTVTETEKLVEAEKPKNAPRFTDAQRNQPAVPMTEDQKKAKQDQVSRVAKATAERYIPTDMLANVTGRNLMAGKPSQALNIRVVGGGPSVAGDAAGPSSALQNYAGGEQGGGYAGMDFGGTGGTNGTNGGGLNGGGGPVVAGLDKDAAGGGGGKLRAAGFEEKEIKAIVATAGEIISSGGLTKKIIQQYMDRQKGAIIACYKKEVQKTPNLEGKVVVAFTISPTGKVMAPGIKTSTLGNSAVESCIVSRLGLFRFPAPENAGAVKVTYPFLFRTR